MRLAVSCFLGILSSDVDIHYVILRVVPSGHLSGFVRRLIYTFVIIIIVIIEVIASNHTLQVTLLI